MRKMKCFLLLTLSAGIIFITPGLTVTAGAAGNMGTYTHGAGGY